MAFFSDDEVANLNKDWQKKQSQKKQVSGRGGTATSLISEGGATGGALAGAAVGTAILPVIGTAIGAGIGGLAGGLAGSAAEQKVRDDKVDWGKAAAEGVISGATGAIAPGGALVKGALKGGAKAVAKNADSAVMNGVEEVAGKAATNTKTFAPNTSTKSTLFGKFRQSANNASSQGYGVTVGQNAGRGRVVTPDDADALQTFITNGSQKYGGIRPGKPIDQARDAQNVLNNVRSSLDETLTKIDRPLQVHEPINITAGAMGKIKDNPAITGTTKTFDKFDQKIKNAKSLKELEAIRREADDLAYTAAGAGKTSAAAQAKAVREAIDDFITPMSAEYKAIKGDYTLAKDALESTSKASKNAKGIPIPFTNGTVTAFDQSIQGLKNKAAAKAAGTQTKSSGTLLDKLRSRSATINPGVAQVGASIAANQIVPDMPEEQQTQDVQIPPPVDTGSTEQTSLYPRENYIADIQRDPANADEYTKLFEIYNGSTATEKPLSAEASKTVGTANSGLQSLQNLVSMIEQGGVPKGTVVPGRGLLGGAGQNILGTAEYDAAADNVADAMVRLRTGAAATKEELALYRRLLPQAFDSPEVRAQKIKQVEDYFNSVASRTGTAGTDLQQMVN